MTTPKLSDRELDAVIAEKVMGQAIEWRWCFEDCGEFYPRSTNAKVASDDEYLPCVLVGDPFNSDSQYLVEMDVRYSSSLDALAPVVKKTIEKFGAVAWIDAMAAAVHGVYDVPRPAMWPPDMMCGLLTASPRQIAEAVVRCWE